MWRWMACSRWSRCCSSSPSSSARPAALWSLYAHTLMAIRLRLHGRLAAPQAIVTMRRYVASGRFPPSHYTTMWQPRIDQALRHRANAQKNRGLTVTTPPPTQAQTSTSSPTSPSSSVSDGSSSPTSPRRVATRTVSKTSSPVRPPPGSDPRPTDACRVCQVRLRTFDMLTPVGLRRCCRAPHRVWRST